MLARRVASLRSAGTLLAFLILPEAACRRNHGRKELGELDQYVRRGRVTSAAAGAVVVRPSVYKVGSVLPQIGCRPVRRWIRIAGLPGARIGAAERVVDASAIAGCGRDRTVHAGPVFSTATFIGYILGGAPGAAVATLGIFLPSFFYVALLAPVLFRLRQSAWIAGFLDSVNVCAVALMGGVTFRLAADALRGWPSWAIAAISLAMILRWKVSPAWVVVGRRDRRASVRRVPVSVILCVSESFKFLTRSNHETANRCGRCCFSYFVLWQGPQTASLL